MKPVTTARSNKSKQIGWIWISGIAFLLCLLASSALILFGKQFEDLGIVGNIYYIILVPLGFSSAAFLAGAMKSYASFKSNASMPYGKLNLTGPVVIFLLVVGGGFIIPDLNKKEEFDQKVRIVSTGKSTESFNEGSVTLYFGKNRRNEDIHKGEALFNSVPAGFHNKRVKVELHINDYRLVDSGDVLISKKQDYIDLPVAGIPVSTAVRGSIVNARNVPVKDALLDFASGLATCRTNENGNFSLNLPIAAGEKVRLRIFINNEVKFNENVTVSPAVPVNLIIE